MWPDPATLCRVVNTSSQKELLRHQWSSSSLWDLWVKIGGKSRENWRDKELKFGPSQVSPALSISSWLIHRFILYIFILGGEMWQHRKYQDREEGAKPSPTCEMRNSRATMGCDREQTVLKVRRQHRVIHQLTRQIPDRMLSNAPGANYWLPVTNWVCILHIFAQTMEVITDYSTALPREGGKSLWEASPEELTWAAWPWPVVVCILMTAAGSAKPPGLHQTQESTTRSMTGLPGNPQ